MNRPFRLTAFVVTCALVATPALAQLPNIFDTLFGPPPRPPADVPSGPRSNLPPPQPLPPGSPPTSIGPRGNVQTQPLPPPPGAVAAPPRAPQDAQPPGAPSQPRPPTRTVTTQPDETIIEPPAVKIANPTAVFAGLDKITGRITAFDVALGETVRFGALEVTPRACYTRPPTETANTDGFVEVDELTLQGELRRIFTGWMYATSPGLNAVEHPIYDVWLTDCKGGEQAPAAEVTPETPPVARPPARRQQPPQRRATAPAPALPPPAPTR